MVDQQKTLKKFDYRTLEYQLDRGEISQADFQKYLSELPDDAANAEEIDLAASEEAEASASTDEDSEDLDEDF
jgi:hypothetical protein